MKRRPLMTVALSLALVGASGCTALGKVGKVLMDPSVPVGAPNDQPTEVAFSMNASPTLNGNPNSLDTTVEKAGTLEPSPYAVSLAAGDPYALTEKVGTLLEYLQAQFPAMSPLQDLPEDEDAAQALARSPMEERAPGSYDDPTVILDLPNPAPVAAEQIATPIAIKILQLRDDSLLRNSVYQLLAQDPAKTLRSTYIRDDDYLLFPGQFKFVPFEPLHADTRFIAVIGDYASQENATWQQVLRIAPRGRQIVLSVLVNDTQIVLKEQD
ncbi:type VI secretion system lipoprotein TssJ [Pseudomonas guariconensis]|uniref:type VI secretion system lipoprotein TssJ n=1 Tax=Pseudomonas TaxID=286 RepID=UPI001CE45843|nr:MULTISPECIES: type VI secretion system lipoprotein TssJ [Pseudomonas]MCO7637682.1 type VI secretion system lipoprotein TssJ [Pseudomonas sp. S 311-6]MCO7517139.1 type VI secretion system lipoprotein TssJ [Pseudomonas putida]MCO7567090.1 type VI secretion system lipoprotein TssJ [Pseudomonas mosselii]MCO7594901.1 type VI secretion system lipoprotein TssJ [Pseudomonas guariconensis]MCO7608201.1 type VI secretion system lipoprotein TssJ [Pseudomonas guariconensis]